MTEFTMNLAGDLAWRDRCVRHQSHQTPQRFLHPLQDGLLEERLQASLFINTSDQKEVISHE